MIIYIGGDHRGFELKNQLRDWLVEQGHKVIDCGNEHLDAEDDYTDFAKVVAQKILKSHGDEHVPNAAEDIADEPAFTSPKYKNFEGVATIPDEVDEDVLPSQDALGILICGSGIGVCITANRFKGIRCGTAFSAAHARHGRENDHINVLGLASNMVEIEQAKEIVHTFINSAPMMKEKYVRRVRKHDMM